MWNELTSIKNVESEFVFHIKAFTYPVNEVSIQMFSYVYFLLLYFKVKDIQPFMK